jgi:hypothetical protein
VSVAALLRQGTLETGLTACCRARRAMADQARAAVAGAARRDAARDGAAGGQSTAERRPPPAVLTSIETTLAFLRVEIAITQRLVQILPRQGLLELARWEDERRRREHGVRTHDSTGLLRTKCDDKPILGDLPRRWRADSCSWFSSPPSVSLRPFNRASNQSVTGEVWWYVGAPTHQVAGAVTLRLLILSSVVLFLMLAVHCPYSARVCSCTRRYHMITHAPDEESNLSAC